MKFWWIPPKLCHRYRASLEVARLAFNSRAKWRRPIEVLSLCSGTHLSSASVSSACPNRNQGSLARKKANKHRRCVRASPRQSWQKLTRLTARNQHRRIVSAPGLTLTITAVSCLFVNPSNRRFQSRCRCPGRNSLKAKASCTRVNRTGRIDQMWTRKRPTRSLWRSATSLTWSWCRFLRMRRRLSRSESSNLRKRVMRKSGSVWRRFLALSGPRQVSALSLPVTNTTTS